MRHLYNTLSMENNTMTLDEMARFATTGQTIPGRSNSEHGEVIGMKKAIAFLKDNDVEARPLSIQVATTPHKILQYNIICVYYVV